ncbi:MAG: hypothetical protein WAV20_08555, partial [Blastocatellia bacterium]
TNGVNVREFEDRVGWDVEPLLNEPSKLASYDIDAVKDISNEIEVDWLSILEALSSTSEHR